MLRCGAGRLIPRPGLGGEYLPCDVVAGLRFDGRSDRSPGEDVEAELAAAFGPCVVLLGQNRADEANDRAAVMDDSDDVGPALDFTI